MSYAIALTIEARHDLARLPKAVRDFTFRQLQSLAQYPTLLSRSSYFPYRTKSQLFQFDFEQEGRWWEICVLFQYGQDEQTLHILKIGFSNPDPWEKVEPGPA